MTAAPGPWRHTGRRVLPRCLAAAIGSLATLVTIGVVAPETGRAEGQAVVDPSDRERLAQQQHQAELAMKLDPAAASTEELIAALTVLDQYVQSLLAQSAEAERGQLDAARRLEEHRLALGETEGEFADVTNALRSQAVRLYLDPEGADGSIRLLRADTFDDAERKRVLGEVIAGNSENLSERMRVVKAERDLHIGEATSAREEGERLERQRQDLFTRVVAGQEAQRRLQEAWDKRMATVAKGTDDIGDVSDLDRAIAEQRAKQAPVAPAPQSSNGRFIWPASGPVTDQYGYLSSRGRNHWGIDIGAPSGANVLAAQSGRVVLAGWNGGYGNLVAIDHPNGLQTRYAHLSRIRVSVGESVSQGQLIGNVGSTGNSTGPHLHFEVYLNGQHRNPFNYLP